VLDLTQQVLLLLFDNGGQVLAAWDPERGLSLDNFVGLVAEREAAAILRSGRRSAWAETPTPDDILELGQVGPEAEQQLSSRDELICIWHRLEAQLSPRGLALTRALLIEEQPIEEVARAFNTSPNALYAFRSRLRRTLKEIRDSLMTAREVSSEASSTGTLPESSPTLVAGAGSLPPQNGAEQ